MEAAAGRKGKDSGVKGWARGVSRNELKIKGRRSGGTSGVAGGKVS